VKVWAVVLSTQSRTWIDSLWVEEQSASQRLDYLRSQRAGAGLGKELGMWISEMKIEDAKLSK
jgi:hypothetical protein